MGIVVFFIIVLIKLVLFWGINILIYLFNFINFSVVFFDVFLISCMLCLGNFVFVVVWDNIEIIVWFE